MKPEECEVLERIAEAQEILAAAVDRLAVAAEKIAQACTVSAAVKAGGGLPW